MLTLIIWALLVLWTWHVAKKNHRSQFLAVVLGIFFGIFAVVGYYIAGEPLWYKYQMGKKDPTV